MSEAQLPVYLRCDSVASAPVRLATFVRQHSSRPPQLLPFANSFLQIWLEAAALCQTKYLQVNPAMKDPKSTVGLRIAAAFLCGAVFKAPHCSQVAFLMTNVEFSGGQAPPNGQDQDSQPPSRRWLQ